MIAGIRLSLPSAARRSCTSACSDGCRVAFGAQLLELRPLLRGHRLVHLEVLGLGFVVVAVLVDADDDSLAVVYGLLPSVGLVEDRLVVVARLDRLDRAAHLLDALHLLGRERSSSFVSDST